ncbi:zinc finger CCCH domain-containing protein 4-like [Helicoverpa zea]|uniref:zinc finger CCCH domain-containing protein 4-like n=1 Tax=Helicoverpa zea TaxID=7113 RepID=UPI001F5699DA|nr:zinc finger CCCH domain-containing protein 4-like [Helicoverpa zea]
MWRLGVLLLGTILLEFAAADVKPTEALLIQRLKRSPDSCDNYDYYPHRRERYWPPPPPGPPPPPFWPPPPPPPGPPGPPGPPFWPHHHHRDRFEEIYDAASRRDDEPCSTCPGGKDTSSALSNAKSQNGDAIAIAVAKASPKS